MGLCSKVRTFGVYTAGGAAGTDADADAGVGLFYIIQSERRVGNRGEGRGGECSGVGIVECLQLGSCGWSAVAAVGSAKDRRRQRRTGAERRPLAEAIR